jgi:hypothetical protein
MAAGDQHLTCESSHVNASTGRDNSGLTGELTRSLSVVGQVISPDYSYSRSYTSPGSSRFRIRTGRERTLLVILLK